jgi:hypothetical protein
MKAVLDAREHPFYRVDSRKELVRIRWDGARPDSQGAQARDPNVYRDN